MVDVMICFPARRLALAAPMMAMLLDSVPPEVNTISEGFAFRVFAIFSAAAFTYCSASMPFL